jgi:hypothetical protein
MVAQNNPGQVFISGNLGTTTSSEGVAAVELGNGLTYTEGSGNMVGVSIGPDGVGSVSLNYAPATGTGTFIPCQITPTFNPSAGSTVFKGLYINPTVKGTSSASTTALVVNPVITTANLTGTNLIADFQSSGSSKASIDYSGNYYSNGTVGVTQTAEAVGTLATIGGIVTTFTAVSDERLKVFSEYEGGLDEVLQITPIRYRWNADGQKISGQSGDRDYVGFSAQNTQKAIPETIQSVTKDGYLSFEDRPVIAALVNAVKTQQQTIKSLEARISELESK